MSGPGRAGAGRGQLETENQQATGDAQRERAAPRLVRVALVVGRWLGIVRAGQLVGRIVEESPGLSLERRERSRGRTMLRHDRLVRRVERDRDPLGGGSVVDP